MADKYEDLHDRIADEIHWDAAVVDVLRWLDNHRDQAPGRTLTRSDMVEAFGEEYAGWATHRLARIGYTIAPDPEVTNVERLDRLLLDLELVADAKHRSAIADALDSEGVKAPGGDDEPDDHV